ncbi:AAA family ATPase [Enterococcus alishanensis]|uniref:AAA family ATPase n=1 Tax=Enterococcus alishanensis TaxID=1303817 RepID=A0ABS6TB65_9ENTE|nr:AAA family ATPase [Enterococcus alishanensis]MBV7390147.1 AAA family ATPase [Enterococcus alishanensis]
MRKVLRCQLFGNPQIFLDDQPVFFAFSKINALIYYLTVNISASRDEIAGMLWPNKTEQNARKNLRNTIYQANKELGAEFIVSPNKSILQLDGALVAPSDARLFTEDPIHYLDEYRDEFLKGFFLKDSESFDLWVIKMRNFFEQKFIQSCYKKVAEDIENNHLEDVEKNIHRLIDIDEYDERNYQMLMRFYQNSHRNGKVIETYYSLAGTLNEELGIQPSDETRKIYEDTLTIVKRNKEQKDATKYRFFGRTAELEVLEANLDCFDRNQPFQSVLIQGDDGVGKTALSQLVLNNASEILLVKASCFQAEQTFTLRMWREIMTQLEPIVLTESIMTETLWRQMCQRFFPSFLDIASTQFEEKIRDTDINHLSQFLLTIMDKLAAKYHIIVYIENLQWIDQPSLKLLTSLLLHNQNCLFLMTLRTDHHREVTDFINAVSHYDKLLQITLKPFPKEAIKAFVKKQIPEQQFDYEICDKLYEESEGNPMFLMEYVKQLRQGGSINYMTAKIKKELEFSLVQLSSMERSVLEVVAYFKNPPYISMIALILEVSEQEIAKAVANLSERNLLIEQAINSKIHVFFKKKKLREHIYSCQSASKIRLIHEKIARLLEEQYKASNDKGLLSLVAYHYKNADQELKSLDYELSNLELSLKFQHELFPIYNEQSKVALELHPLEFQKEFEKFEEIGHQLKSNEELYGDMNDYQQLLMKYLYLEGRYLINRGDYHSGIEDIQRVIVQAKEYHHDDILAKAYRQMIYFFIQTDNAIEMALYIDMAMTIAIKSNDHESIGILLRLKGLYHLMIGELSEAERLCQESITIFTISNEVREKYASNIAASYDYLAEIERLRKNYNQAVFYMKKAIALCEETSLITSLVIFYVDMGISYFAAGNYQQARHYLQRSNEMYTNIISPWKRTQLSVYLALIDLLEGNYQAVYESLLRFSEVQGQMTNPRDSGIVYFFKAIVKHLLTIKALDTPKIEKLLNYSSNHYYKKAVENLSAYRDQFELNYLKDTFEEVKTTE